MKKNKIAKFYKKEYEYYIAIFLVFSAVLFWGLSYISTKFLLNLISPVPLAFYRQVIATATLIPLALYAHALSGITRRDFGIFAIASFVGLVFCFTLKNVGLQYTTASNASMIISAAPIFTLFSEALFFKLKITRNMISSLVLSIIGVYLLVTLNGRIDVSSTYFFGNLMTIGAMICWVFYTILNKGCNERYSSIKIVTYQSIIAVFLYLPFVALDIGKLRPMHLLSPFSLINLIFLGVCCSAFAYIFYNYSINRLGATVSSSILNLIPVVTVLFGHFLLQEKMSWIQILGMILILVALYLLKQASILDSIHMRD